MSFSCSNDATRVDKATAGAGDITLRGAVFVVFFSLYNGNCKVSRLIIKNSNQFHKPTVLGQKHPEEKKKCSDSFPVVRF